jgi:uncharacterized protein YbaR (Trm112 family)
MTDWKDDLVCPYCKHKDSDPWEHFTRGSGSTNVLCHHCGKWFLAEADFSVMYAADKLPCQNGEGDHDWSEWDNWGDVNDTRYCKACDYREYRRKEGC